MSTYALVKRGVISAVATDTSPLLVTLPGSGGVKSASAFRVGSVRSNRRRTKLQSGSFSLTDADASPKDVTVTAVDLAKAKASLTFKEKRTNNRSGITVKFLNTTTLRFQFDTIAAGDTLDAEWLVEENVDYKDATVRLASDTQVELAWDGGALLAGETITASYDVWDLSNFGNDMKEVLFRLARVLAYHGENTIQDLITYDDPGNVIQYRLRVFDTRAHAEACTPDLPDGQDLETGELARVRMTQEILASQNDRTLLTRVLTDLLATPGVD